MILAVKTSEKIKAIVPFNICGLCVHSLLPISQQPATLNYSLSELALKEFILLPSPYQVAANEKPTSLAAAALEGFHRNPHSQIPFEKHSSESLLLSS